MKNLIQRKLHVCFSLLLLIYSFVAANSTGQLKAQTSTFACPCEGPDAINIDAGNGTLLSTFIADGDMPASSVTTCLAIKGHLIVDAAAMNNFGFYWFNDSEVRMQPGSKITVGAGAYLAIYEKGVNNRGVHGCTALWQGIELASSTPESSGGRLKLQGTFVDDAVHAVTFGNFSTFEMTYTKLRKNHIGLYAPMGELVTTVLQPTRPFRCTIEAREDLLPSYPGQVVATGAVSHAGIEFNGLRYFNIGNDDEGFNIANARYGIILHASGIALYNSRIYEIVTDPDDPNSGTGIFADNYSHITIQDSRMLNMRNGIVAENTFLYATENVLGEDFYGIRGNLEHGIQLVLGGNDQAHIKDGNSIFAQSCAIDVSITQDRNWLEIKDNTIELYPPDAGVVNQSAIHIGASSVITTNTDLIRIQDNDINLHSDGGGINLVNIVDSEIKENAISFLKTYQSTDTEFGIALQQSPANFIKGNEISAMNPNATPGGIYVDSSVKNKFCCNTVTDTYFGVMFNGSCNDTELRSTNFIGNTIGLQCNAGTRIGQQVNAGNIWDQNVLWEARHLSTDPNFVLQSLFYVKPPSGTAVWPGDVFVAAPGVDWFVEGDTAASCEEDDRCSGPNMRPLDSNDELIIGAVDNAADLPESATNPATSFETRDAIQVFPNPATYHLNIEFKNDDLSKIEVELLDVSGKLQIATSTNESRLQLNISQLLPGIYVLKIEQYGSFFYKRIVVN